MTQQSLSDLQAELVAIRQKLADLEAKQGDSKPTTNSVRRRGFSKGLPFGWIPWVASIVLISGLVFAQSKDALFIDKDSNVGIGTTNPKAPLDVNGNAVIEGSLDVNGNAVILGNVGVGTSEPKGFQVVLPESSKEPITGPGITLAGGKEGNADIELRNDGKGTPYIDFSQGTDKDYNARIILSSKDELKIEAKKVNIQGDLGVTGKVTAPGIVTGGIFVVMDRPSKKTKKCTSFGTGQCPRKCAPGYIVQPVVHHYCNVHPLGDGYCYLNFCISN